MWSDIKIKTLFAMVYNVERRERQLSFIKSET